MIRAEQFVEAARDAGYGTYAGVPCSFLTPFINCVIGDPDLTYISSANEGDAVAAAAGAFIGGRRSVAMMQNSGLGNAVSPLSSLTYIFRIPMLVICTHRGAPGVKDEPQHELMGQITGSLFDTMRIPWGHFPAETDEIQPALQRAQTCINDDRRPYALIMKKGTVQAHPLENRNRGVLERCHDIEGNGFTRRPAERVARARALQRIVAATSLEQTVVIATTGFTGRELWAIADRPNHLYMVGSMGCAPSLGLGLAMARPDLHVVVIDGDGAALMRMGNFATVGNYAAGNFTHILLDNEAHDSTGAQATVTANVDFAQIAAACGYARVIRDDGVEAIDDVLGDVCATGPRFLHLKIGTGTIPDLPRPTIKPPEVLQRLMTHIGALS